MGNDEVQTCQLRDDEIKRVPATIPNIGPLAGGASLATEVKKAIAEADPDQPVTNIMMMDKVLTASLGDWRFYMQLLGIFAGIAVSLAAVGVMSYTVSERTHEIGIRMTLGAHSADVLGLIGRLWLKLTCIGVAIGVGLAVGAARLISTFLFGVKPNGSADVRSRGAGWFVALLACHIPARRAIKVDPIGALRHE